MNTFTQRRIDVTFTLEPTATLSAPTTVTRPVFAESGKNSVTLKGYRVSASIRNAGGFSMGMLQMRVYGMTLSLMNQLATLGNLPLAGRNNTVTVSAGDDVNGVGICFEGTITNAWADFKGAPDVAFHVTANGSMRAALAAIPPSSYSGAASVAVIMQKLATQAGLRFENAGVTAVLADPYFPGTALQQAQACATAAGIDMVIENGTLIITPRGQPRAPEPVLVSANTGMVGYPSYTASGIAVTTIFNPRLTMHSLIKTESILTPASGTWRIYSLMHDVESETPKGAWFSSFEASEPQNVPIR